MAPACGEVGSGVLSGVGHMTPRFAFPETHGAVQHEVVATVFAAHSSLLHFHNRKGVCSLNPPVLNAFLLALTMCGRAVAMPQAL